MKKTTKAVPVEAEAVQTTSDAIKVIRFVTPYTEEMTIDLENRLNDLASVGFSIAACVPYGVDHVVIFLQKNVP